MFTSMKVIFVDKSYNSLSIHIWEWFVYYCYYCNKPEWHFPIYLLGNWIDLDKTWQRDGDGKSDLWGLISQQPYELKGWFKLNTYRKLYTASPMLTWSMTSLNPKRSRSRPQYLTDLISQQSCETERWFWWTNHSKSYFTSRTITWWITLGNPKGQNCDPKIPVTQYLDHCEREG